MRGAPPAGKDRYVVYQNTTELLGQPAASLALVKAQERAMRWPGEDAVTLFVFRESLFGPATELYRVTRGADGVVSTFTINSED